MGTWAIDALGNDDAGDWLYQLYSGDSGAVIEKAISQALEAEYLEAPEAQEALAAAEIIARLQGHPDANSSSDEELDAWLAANKQVLPPDLIHRATLVIDRVLDEGSELSELWKESEDFEAWRSSVANLKARIG